MKSPCPAIPELSVLARGAGEDGGNEGKKREGKKRVKSDFQAAKKYGKIGEEKQRGRGNK